MCIETKALISFAVTTKLICVFVFAYAKSRFSHNEAHLSMMLHVICYTSGAGSESECIYMFYFLTFDDSL